jgi:hypothetical protein
MIKVRGDKLSRRDRRFLKRAAQYTMDYLLPVNSKIKINFVIGPRAADESEDFNAVCTYIRKAEFEIWINQNKINKRAKTLLGKFGKILSYVVHELVHVKQYASSELVHVGDKYRYRGRLYNQPKDGDEDAYFESPEEIEAYGRELHLVKRFVKHWKKVKDEQF